MKFRKIRGDLRLFERVSEDDVQLTEILTLLVDILHDVMDETDKELQNFSLSDEEVSLWLSLCRSLNSVSADKVLSGTMPDKRQEKILQTKKSLQEKIDMIQKLETEVSQLASVNMELKEKEKAYNAVILQKQELILF